MHAEISFNYDDMLRPGVTTIDIMDDTKMTVSVLLRHQGERLYFFSVQGIDDASIMAEIRQAIDVLPSQLERYGWLKGTTDLLLYARCEQALYLGQFGFGWIEDRFFSNETLMKKGIPGSLGTPTMREFVCVAELDTSPSR